MQEERGEHPQKGEECPVGLVVVEKVRTGEQISHHVCHVQSTVDQEEEWALPPPSAWSLRHQPS